MSDQSTPTSVPPTPPATTAPSTQSLDDILNQLEKTTGTGPSPTVGTTVPAMTEEAPPAVPSEPVSTPVSTITENAIPAPEPIPPSQPAPMVQEEPGLGAVAPITPEPALEPIPEPVPEPMSTPMPEPAPEPTPELVMTPAESAPPIIPETPAETPMPAPEPVAPPTGEPKKSSNMGKIITGVIGVLLLAGAAGVGIFLTQQPQETRTPAASPPTAVVAQPVTAPTRTAVPIQIQGKICTDTKITTPGNVYAMNLDTKTVKVTPITVGQTSYTLSLATGTYKFIYTADKTFNRSGYTIAVECQKTGKTCTDHRLNSVPVVNYLTYSNIDLCDSTIDQSSVPTENYATQP